MDIEEQRKLALNIMGSHGATRTRSLIELRAASVGDILISAADEMGLDAFVSCVLQGPPEWAATALMQVPNIAKHGATLRKRIASVPVTMTHPLTDKVNDSIGKVQRDAATLSTPVSGYYLFVDGSVGAFVWWTMFWGAYGTADQQPNKEYPDWNSWKTVSLNVGAGALATCHEFQQAVPNAPLNTGDRVWIYAKCRAGSGVDSYNVASVATTFDQSSPLIAYYEMGGSIDCPTLYLSSVK